MRPPMADRATRAEDPVHQRRLTGVVAVPCLCVGGVVPVVKVRRGDEPAKRTAFESNVGVDEQSLEAPPDQTARPTSGAGTRAPATAARLRHGRPRGRPGAAVAGRASPSFRSSGGACGPPQPRQLVARSVALVPQTSASTSASTAKSLSVVVRLLRPRTGPARRCVSRRGRPPGTDAASGGGDQLVGDRMNDVGALTSSA